MVIERGEMVEAVRTDRQVAGLVGQHASKRCGAPPRPFLLDEW